MALELCIETYGSMAPFLDGQMVGALPRLRRVAESGRHSGPVSAPVAAKVERDVPRPVTSVGESLARRVQNIADRLPFLLAQALWLVDVCGCSYREAAEELSTTPEVIGRRVAAGRAEIRAQLLQPPVVPVELPGRGSG